MSAGSSGDAGPSAGGSYQDPWLRPADFSLPGSSESAGKPDTDQPGDDRPTQTAAYPPRPQWPGQPASPASPTPPAGSAAPPAGSPAPPADPAPWSSPAPAAGSPWSGSASGGAPAGLPGYPPSGYQPAARPGYPPYSQVPQPGYSPAYGWQPSGRVNRAAIAALVLGIVQFFLGLLVVANILAAVPAVICGIVGIRQTTLRGQRGKGMAIAGLVLGILGIAYFLLVLMVIAAGLRARH